MNVFMEIREPSANELCFFTKLRDQGVPFFTTSSPNGRGNKHKYVSSRSLIEIVGRDNKGYAFSRVFYIRERDLPLVMMMSEFQVNAWQ